jgi:hypothetical protein
MLLRFAVVGVALGLVAWIGAALIRRRHHDFDAGTVSSDWISKERGKSDIAW